MSLLIPKDPAETVKETLKLKTTPVDEWNLREQLALAIAVRDSGSQVIVNFLELGLCHTKYPN